MGQFTEAVRSARGRADAVVKTADYTYVFNSNWTAVPRRLYNRLMKKGIRSLTGLM